jgi:hypothetical protein
MECRLAGESEVLGENLPQRHFCPSQNSTCPDLGLNPGGRGGKPVTNRLSHGAANMRVYSNRLSSGVTAIFAAVPVSCAPDFGDKFRWPRTGVLNSIKTRVIQFNWQDSRGPHHVYKFS